MDASDPRPNLFYLTPWFSMATGGGTGMTGIGGRVGWRTADTVEVELGGSYRRIDGLHTVADQPTANAGAVDLRFSFGNAHGNRVGVFAGSSLVIRPNGSDKTDCYLTFPAGLDVREELFGTSGARMHLGLRIFVEPWIPVGGGRVSAMFGTELVVSFGGSTYDEVDIDDEDDELSGVARSMARYAYSELSDVTVGDATVESCSLRAPESWARPQATDRSRGCDADWTESVRAGHCALFVALVRGLGSVSLAADFGEGDAAPTLVRDEFGATWASVMLCNPDDEARDVRVFTQATRVTSAVPIAVWRWDLAIVPSFPTLQRPEIAACGTGEVGANQCCVKHFAGAQGRSATPADIVLSSDVSRVHVTAPWVSHVNVRSEDVRPRDSGRLFWHDWQRLEVASDGPTTLQAQASWVGGPLVLCTSGEQDEEEQDEPPEGDGAQPVTPRTPPGGDDQLPLPPSVEGDLDGP